MVVRIVRILSIVVLLLLADLRPASCEGWSLPNPFSSDAKTDAKKRTTTRTTRQEPSTWNKVGTGTKNFFSKTGETLGLKKPETKKPLYASPAPRVIKPPARKQESKSWFGSLLKSEEPKKDKTVSEWMDKPRLDP
jgi:hypothetical protein